MPPQGAGNYPTPNASQQAPSSAPQQQSASQTAPSAPVPNNSNAGSAASTDAESVNGEGDISVSADEHVITAELVGTFYRAPSPDAEPFVEVGDRIEEGDVLCIIEAMKIMNEIECETSGVIKKVLVDNAEPVEFDQPLFVIEPA
jgi:acetyl-CoA carboxylase biotin carboxyl carrier protein